MLQLHSSEEAMSPPTKAGITTAKGLLDLPGGQYCHTSEESMSLPEEAMGSPKQAGITAAEGLLDLPGDQYCHTSEEAVNSPEEAINSPKKAGITAAKGLFDLPGEIRNRIYDYVADGGDTFKITKLAIEELANRRRYIKLLECNKLFNIGLPSLGLAQLCRILRAEFRPIFIARTTFVIQGKDIDALIRDIILPPDTDIHSTAARIVIDAAKDHFSVDLKPLLRISQVAKDVSIVIKKTHLYYPAEEFKDRTIQELLRIILGIQDTETFLSFVERAVCSMTLDVLPFKMRFPVEPEGREEAHRTNLVRSLDMGLVDRHWSSWFDEWNVRCQEELRRWPCKFLSEETYRSLSEGTQREILGTGMALLYDRRGPRTPINFLKIGEQWQEQLKELPWSEDTKAGEKPEKEEQL